MKSMLILDRPRVCGECSLNEQRPLMDTKVCVCNARGMMVGADELTTIPDWCPLKPMPKKKWEWVDAEDTIWNLGWNACIEEIENG